MKAGNGKDERYYDEGSTPKPGEKRWDDAKTSAQEAVKRANELGSRGRGLLGTGNRPVILLTAGIGLSIVLALLVYLLVSSPSRPSGATGTGIPAATDSAQSRTATGQTNQPPQLPATTAGQGSSAPTIAQSTSGQPTTTNPSRTGAGSPSLSLNSGTEPDQQQSWPVRIALVALSMALASLMGAILAFRPRKDVPASLRSSQMSQIEILLAVLAAGVVLVASTGIAFAAGVLALGLFVRIGPTVRDSKESTVMLVAAGAGVACGAERWEVALILTGLAFVILWALEHPEARKSETSIEVTVDTLNVQETNEVLRDVFDRNYASAEFRKAERKSGETLVSSPRPVFTIVYEIRASGDLGLDRLTDEIFSSDPDNVLSVDWHQTKSQHQYELSRI